ncbi:uncharacterized protein [Brachyistius frenatus]|uniref:uncharacterized protein n=1 Tax=Brachyistius frenatus TaxID=100188 RepID=UPI0037E978AF
MSAELYSVSGPGGNNESFQGTTVGGNKPLHRFIRGQPKMIGIVVLVLGVSLFTVSVSIVTDTYNYHLLTAIPSGFLLGSMCIVTGILYILTEHNPTKKTVTISLALSVVSVLLSGWTILHILPGMGPYPYRHRHSVYLDSEDNFTKSLSDWSLEYEDMGETLAAIFLFHSFVGGIIFIVMSAFAGAALRSTKSQAIVMITTTPSETPAE